MKTRAIIDARLTRMRLGNPGHYRSLGEGVFEIKIDYGPGYRIYFGEHNHSLVILLCGGTKRHQSSDIKHALQYWKDYCKE